MHKFKERRNRNQTPIPVHDAEAGHFLEENPFWGILKVTFLMFLICQECDFFILLLCLFSLLFDEK